MPIQAIVHKTTLHSGESQQERDLMYWLAQPVRARLAAVEELRKQMTGYDAEPRLQRVCTITQLKPR